MAPDNIPDDMIKNGIPEETIKNDVVRMEKASYYKIDEQRYSPILITCECGKRQYLPKNCVALNCYNCGRFIIIKLPIEN